MVKKFIDLVISGCDFSGTSTQLNGIIENLQAQGKKIRDLRGSETDAMFHAEVLSPFNDHHLNFTEFKKDPTVPHFTQANVQNIINGILGEENLKVASMVRNDTTKFIDPNSADIWIMEEPTHRGAGQTIRFFELYRSKFGSVMNNTSVAYAHQAYRSEEFFRFRKVLRDSGKVVIRSRSEESACYQIEDEKGVVEQGIPRELYLSLPGHQVAFANPPTHIFLVTGPEDWNPREYIKLRTQRLGTRVIDDYESRVGYQLLINKRYASDWIDNLYKEACARYGSKPPQIIRFSIYDSKEDLIWKMTEKLKELMMIKEADDVSY